MKKIILAGILLLTLTGCGNGTGEKNTDDMTAQDSAEITTELASTGYPTGQLQGEYVYAEGQLYQSAFETVQLPQNAEKVGEVQKIDNVEYPDEELEASYLEIGTPVYKSGDMVYIEDGAGMYRRYEPVREDADGSDKSFVLKSMDLSGLPVVEIIGAKEGTLPDPFPDLEQITETKGRIAGCAVTDEGAYYIVSYDDRYRDDMCRQYAFYKQTFGNSELELLAENLYDEGRFVTFTGIENGELVWYQLSQQQDIMYKCRLENASVVETVLEGEEGEYPLETMDRELTEEFAGWEQEIPEEYLSGQICFAGMNDSYIVFEQMIEHPYVEGKITDSYINVYDRKSNEMRQICREDYGIAYLPALSGDFIMFLVSDDVLGYEEQDSYYQNVYLVYLDTMEVSRITENSSAKDSTKEEAMFSLPETSDGYLYFIERGGQDLEYRYLYYLETE